MEPSRDPLESRIGLAQLARTSARTVGALWWVCQVGCVLPKASVSPELGAVDPTSLHQTCEVLTNRHVKQDGALPLARRKNAMRRMTRRRCELILRRVEQKGPLRPLDRRRMATLQRMRLSYAEKVSLGRPPSLAQKLSMLTQGWRSRGYLKIPRETHCDVRDPKPGMFWRPLAGREARQQAFERLARRKKFTVPKTLVVRFDKVTQGSSAAKIKVRDLDPERDNDWVVKWGDEAHTDVAASRLFAALGYDVDHPYHKRADELIVVFEPGSEAIQTPDQLIAQLQRSFGLDLRPWVSAQGRVDPRMMKRYPELAAFQGSHYMQFVEALVEARPDRVKRLGSFLPNELDHPTQRALRGALLAHLWIDNWDTRRSNTLLTTLHRGNHNYQLSAVFSDLGTSMGVELNYLPADFKVGLVNAMDWNLVTRHDDRFIQFRGRLNAWLAPYQQANACDLHWMALHIAQIDEAILRDAVAWAHWPKAVAELYVHKLAARRDQILRAFQITDPHPIPYNKQLHISDSEGYIVRAGQLVGSPVNAPMHPEGLVAGKGRLRGFGR